MPFRSLLSFSPLAALACVSASACIGVCATAQNAPAKPGDRVVLRIARDSLVGDTLRIDPRGMVVVPLVGDVHLGDLAGDVIQDTLRSRLAKFVNPAAVEAILLRRVNVVGEVGRPGVYYVDRTFALRDVVAMAGGVTTQAQERRLSLIRAGATSVVADWRTGPESSQPIESGDVLVVDRLPWYRREILAIVTGVGILTSIVITLSK